MSDQPGAVMLELDLIQFPNEGGSWSVFIRPRINTQELSDLSEWPEWYDETKIN